MKDEDANNGESADTHQQQTGNNEKKHMQWLQRFRRSSAHTQANIVCTFFVLVATIAYTWIAGCQLTKMSGQLGTMNTTYLEIQKQTWAAQESAYVACINAQVATHTLAQMQADAVDSHATTLATVRQAVVATESERATLEPLTGDPGIVKDPRSGQQAMVIPFDLENRGKAEASSISIRVFAVYLPSSEKPRFSYGYKDVTNIYYPILKGGKRIGEDSSKLVAGGVPVHTYSGKTILNPTQDVLEEIKAGEASYMIHAEIGYWDGFGIRRKRDFCKTISYPAIGLTKTGGAPIECSEYNKESATGDNIRFRPKQSAINTSALPDLTCPAPPPSPVAK